LRQANNINLHHLSHYKPNPSSLGRIALVYKTVVINAVGLTQQLLARMPNAQKAGRAATIEHVTPAVTCSVQATYLTGTLPREHGIVGNGWYFRDECEVRFWHQSDKLVQRPRIWEIAKARDASFTCANLFWWNAMYSSADVTVTPRPMYPADGRKLPDVWTHPADLRFELQAKLGQFPLFKFWGPGASIESTAWIASSAMEVDRRFNPTLTLIYLPHLDYALQQFGPEDARIDADLNQTGTRVVILSEYGIEPVTKPPVHLNRALRNQGLLAVRDEVGHELLDAGASAAFAVADHQIAHVYVNDLSKINQVDEILRSTPGVAEVFDRNAQRAIGLDHPRSGEFVAIAEPGTWFTYYYWLDGARAPDYARTVDIHRKPGYDPAELFLNPKLSLVQARIAMKLLQRRLGFRTLLDVIPLDATLVRGTHGREPARADQRPVFISSLRMDDDSIPASEVCASLLLHLAL
jgi:predicted AlkP superfamily pyrophosphatase or phosphodiesterase